MTKRIGLLILLTLVFFGCDRHEEPPQLLQSFCSEIEFTVQELSGTASLYKESDDSLSLELISPETLCGYRLSLSDGELSLAFGEVTSVLEGGFPDAALITVLHDALSSQSESLSVTFSDPYWEISGVFPNAAGDYLLTVSDAGIPLALLAEHAEIAVRFHQTEPLPERSA